MPRKPVKRLVPRELTEEYFHGDDLYIETNFGDEGQCLIVYKHQTAINESFNTRIVGSSLSAALDVLRTIRSKQR